MTTRIEVLQRHIDDGEPNDCECCALALAAQDHFGVEDACVEMGVLYVGWDDDVDDWEFVYTLPDEANEFYQRFDNYEDVEPFAFELGDPQ